MPPGFQVQCCVNGKSKNYVSFTYSYPSGTGKGGWWVTGRTRCLNYYRTLWSFPIDHITLRPCCHSINTFLSSSLLTHTPHPLSSLSPPPPPLPPYPCVFIFYFIIFNISSHSTTTTHKHTPPQCFAWTWPQFVNILPLAHPLCWYNDHLTVKSKASRKLGRRQQRGQQHWSNYVSFSPSILTLMKSLIVRGRGRWGGEDRCTKCTSFIYLILWNERKERQE